MNHRFWSGLLALALATPSAAAIAQDKSKTKPAAQTATRNPKVNFKEHKLKNGLRVLLAEDHSAPVVSIAVTYDVGSRNERKGRTGFAHLFEHMMFQGSENVGKGEHFVLVFNNGGTMNGTTSEDRTNYFESLPANQLDLAIFLEADRMRSLAVTQENLDNQRNAVQEERRLGVDNQPYGRTDEKLQETMYDNFAYQHTTIGSMEDLNAATVGDVKDFFRIYYAPNNATLALVGDFKSDEALAKIRQQFEAIPTQPTPPPVDVTEPAQKAERRFTVEDPLARLARLDIVFKGVVGNTPDYYAMQVLNQVLASGQSSRLFQRLVKEKELTAGVQGFVDEKRGPGSEYIQATVAPGKKAEDVEATIYDEIAKIQQEGVTDAELETAKQLIRRGIIQSGNPFDTLQTSLGVAVRLSRYAVFYNDPNLINTQFEKVAAVTKADVQRVAKQYLNATNRTVALTVPQSKAPGAPSAGGK